MVKQADNVLENFSLNTLLKLMKGPAESKHIFTTTVMDLFNLYKQIFGSSCCGDINGNFKYRYDHVIDYITYVTDDNNNYTSMFSTSYVRIYQIYYDNNIHCYLKKDYADDRLYIINPSIVASINNQTKADDFYVNDISLLGNFGEFIIRNADILEPHLCDNKMAVRCKNLV